MVSFCDLIPAASILVKNQLLNAFLINFSAILIGLSSLMFKLISGGMNFNDFHTTERTVLFGHFLTLPYFVIQFRQLRPSLVIAFFHIIVPVGERLLPHDEFFIFRRYIIR